MLYLGNASSPQVRDAMRAGQLGQMCTPAEGRQVLTGPDDAPVAYAADNGCYGGRFPGADTWFTWLSRLVEGKEARCLFAVAPDQFDPTLGYDMGRVSLDYSRRFFADIAVLGVPVALVCQNGLTPDMVPWAEIDWLFLGGWRECVPCRWVDPSFGPADPCPTCERPLTEWKTSREAQALCAAARPVWRGDAWKRVHMGRVNSARRWRLAEAMGCDSADGTFLAFGPDKNLTRMQRWPDHNLFGRPA